MAKVQIALERLLPELRDLQHQEIFSRDEIQGIVVKRKGFETALAKRDVNIMDYLRYIEYEQKLEKLRKLRAARKKGGSAKKTLSSFSIPAHVLTLYRQGVARFPSSHALWSAYLSHVLTLPSPSVISKAFSALLALHPTKAEYWVLASRWESNGSEKGVGGGNEEGARRMCMRGLRFVRGAKEGELDLWKEWIRVEVGFIERLKKRWKVLGLVPDEDEEMALGDADEDEEMQEDGQDVDGELQKEVNKASKEGEDAVLGGAVVRLVLDNALSSQKHSLEAYEVILAYLRTLPTSLRRSLLAHVFSSLESHLPEPAEAAYPSFLTILASRHLYSENYFPDKAEVATKFEASQLEQGALNHGVEYVDGVAQSLDVFWAATKKLGKKSSKDAQSAAAAGKVWLAFAQFILQLLADERTTEDLAAYLNAQAERLWITAPKTPELGLLQLEHAEETGKTVKDRLALSELLLVEHSRAGPKLREALWLARLELVTLGGSRDRKKVELALTAAVEELPWSSQVWEVACAWHEGQAGAHWARSEGWFRDAVLRTQKSDARPPPEAQEEDDDDETARSLVPKRYFDLLYTSDNTPPDSKDAGLALLLSLPSLPAAFFSHVLLAIDSLPDATTRKIFESAVSRPDADASRWIEYACWECEKGRVAQGTSVRRRAETALPGAEVGRLWEQRMANA